MTDGETPADASKKTKGDLSYHYWHGRNTGEAPAATAKRITNEEAEALTRQISSTQISAWNSAGTWEERGHTAWAKARLEALVVERGEFRLGGAHEGTTVRVDGVKKCEGDANVVMIRGKPRHGFDFETTLTWTAVFPAEDEADEEDKKDGSDGDDDEEDDGGIEIKGTIHVPEASRECAEDEECQFEIKVEDRKAERRDKEDACYAAVKKGAEGFLVDILKTIDAELAERAKA